jgi:hypothetical protein
MGLQEMIFHRVGGLAAVLFLGCLSGPALAQGMGNLSGNVAADFDRYDVNGRSADQWNASGSAVLTLDNPGGDIQANFANAGVNTLGTKKIAGTSSDDWTYGADAYWRDYAGDFGVNITDHNIPKGEGETFVSGGFFGEFFALSDLTLRAKGGRLQGDADGWYGDSGLVFYPLDAIAISLTGDYARLQHGGPQVTDGGLSIEYLPVRDVPVSLSLGYTYARYEHMTGGFAGDSNIFSIALKAYFGGGGRNGALVDYQRNGATSWDGAPSTIIGTTF